MSDAIDQVRVRILGAKSDTDLLHQSLSTNPASIQIQQYGKADQGTNLAFGVAEVMLILALINGTNALTSLCEKIHSVMKTPQSKVIVIQTPMGRVEIRSSENLTQQEVEDLIRRIARKPS